ncbi:unnamed protein product [Ilex paraguariensis]|uniref:Uncharacterized protein n=1 Tax=Ilex paraguariensis TaxID=185542 RepID=A0ABC8RD10_9AQUA
MAFKGNFFAILDDEEGDDVSKLLARVAAKVEATSRPSTAEKQQNKKEQQQQKSVTVPHSEYVRACRGGGRQRGGQGHESERYHRNDMERFENGPPKGYQQNYRDINGYQRYNGQSKGCLYDNGGADGYWQVKQASGYQHSGQVNGSEQNHSGGYQHKNSDNFAGSTFDGDWQVQRRRRRRDRFNEGNWLCDNQWELPESPNGSWNINGEMQSGNGMEIGDNQGDEMQSGNGNWNSNAGKRENIGGHRGSRTREGLLSGEHEERDNGRGEGIESSKSKEVLCNTGEREVNEDSNSNGTEDMKMLVLELQAFNSHSGGMVVKMYDIPYHSSSKRIISVTSEVSKDAERKKGKTDKHGQDAAQNDSEDKAKQKIEERNKMTLKEYQKQLLVKRKTLEALKMGERKVTLDKDFELMQLVGKKKEDDIFIKLNSEKDKRRKKESLDKDGKGRKSMSIDEFLKPAEGKYYGRRRIPYHLRRDGRENGEQYLNRGVSVGDEDEGKDVPVPPDQKKDDVPAPGDSLQFPDLRGSIKG